MQKRMTRQTNVPRYAEDFAKVLAKDLAGGTGVGFGSVFTYEYLFRSLVDSKYGIPKRVKIIDIDFMGIKIQKSVPMPSMVSNFVVDVLTLGASWATYKWNPFTDKKRYTLSGQVLAFLMILGGWGGKGGWGFGTGPDYGQIAAKEAGIVDGATIGDAPVHTVVVSSELPAEGGEATIYTKMDLARTGFYVPIDILDNTVHVKFRESDTPLGNYKFTLQVRKTDGTYEDITLSEFAAVVEEGKRTGTVDTVNVWMTWGEPMQHPLKTDVIAVVEGTGLKKIESGPLDPIGYIGSTR